MDDWQACLAPQCQVALVQAREDVASRGGWVITAEDFLLALLDAVPDITPFLKRQGVDLDELVRTIQGEQPIVAEVRGDGDLSSQLIYWICRARETTECLWLDWPQLLWGLACCSERLQDKAYVAVLELVGHWPAEPADRPVPVVAPEPEITPVSVTDAAWLELAEDVAVAMAANQRALIWVQGARGSGKSAWLQTLQALPGFTWVQIDPRRQADIMASDQAVVPVDPGSETPWPALVLDNVAPADLQALMAEPGGVVRELVTGWQGPILLLAADNELLVDHNQLGPLLGRTLEIVAMPGMSLVQRRAIITAHQSVIEKRWNVQISPAALEFAASRRSRCVATPGGMLEWVRRAAARLDMFASRGPLQAVAVAEHYDVLRRQSLVALAREEDWQVAEKEMDALLIDQAAAEVVWHERKQAGTLRRLLAEDLCTELERWVAARPGPVHYVLHCDQQQGDSLGAGSGNLYS